MKIKKIKSKIKSTSSANTNQLIIIILQDNLQKFFTQAK